MLIPVKRILLILVLSFWGVTGHSNDGTTDSLTSLLKVIRQDTSRIGILYQLFYQYYHRDPKRAAGVAEEMNSLADSIDYKINPDYYVHLAGLYFSQEEYIGALKYYTLASERYTSTGDDKKKAEALVNKSYTHYIVGEYDEALKTLVETIRIIETGNFSDLYPFTYAVFGFVYRDIKDYKRSKEYFDLCYETSINSGQRSYEHTALNEIGNLYTLQGDYETAVSYHTRSLAVKKEIGDSVNLIYTYNDIACDYSAMGDYDRALDYYRKSLELAERQNNQMVMAANYHNIGSILAAKGKTGEALSSLRKSLEIADRLSLLSQSKEVFSSLSTLYARIGDYKNAYESHRQFFVFHDSIMNENISKTIQELQTRYETEKKEKEIELLNKDRQVQQLELLKKGEEVQKQRTIILSMIVGFLIICISAVWLFLLYKDKKKANKLLARQHEEILEKNEELQQQSEEIHTINDQLHHAYNEISDKNREIIDSIQYARQIQRAILPDRKILESVFPESFVFYRPRDIIGGDFYWATTIATTNIVGAKGLSPLPILVVAVADCTGHGVPGALMSMLGISLLNEIVLDMGIIRPADILNELRRKVIETLRQSTEIGSAKDGMDMALCAFHIQEGTLEYAGANNPLWIIRKYG
ncbi:MAG: tetratricopeptide repeat protein, partial [Bacteroidetes bacterium]|nr:tetratricopeptide repeat protein [Bacteroidota bacterium]